VALTAVERVAARPAPRLLGLERLAAGQERPEAQIPQLLARLGRERGDTRVEPGRLVGLQAGVGARRDGGAQRLGTREERVGLGISAAAHADPLGGGRADSVLTGGGLSSPATSTECWDNNFASQYVHNSWDSSGWGSASACVYSNAEYAR
jgi:hypothetical protein